MFAPKNVLHAVLALFVGLFTGAVVLVLGPAVTPAGATGPACSYTLTSTTQTLKANCTTNHSIKLQRKIFDGANHTITVVNPGNVAYTGSVVVDNGTELGATVEYVSIKGSYTQTCDPNGYPQAVGVEIDNASATINHVTISGMNTGNNCTVNYDGSYGIVIAGGESAAHKHLVTIENSSLSGYVGVGMYIYGNVVATVKNNTLVAANSVDGATDIQLDYQQGGSITPQPLITGNHITNVSTHPNGCESINMFGSNYDQTGSGKVSNNTIDLSCPVGRYSRGGIYLNEGSNIIMNANTITEAHDDYGVGIEADCNSHEFANHNGVDNSSITGALQGVTIESYQNSKTPPTCGGEANNNGVVGNKITDLNSGNPAGEDGVYIFECTPTILTSTTGCYTDATVVSGNTFDGYSTNVLDEGSGSIISGLATPPGHLVAPLTTVRPDRPGH